MSLLGSNVNVGGGSDSSRGGSSSCLKNKKEPLDFEPWKPSPTGSPDPTAAAAAGGINGSSAGQEAGAKNDDTSKKTVLLKSTLSSNIGEYGCVAQTSFKCFLSPL